MYLLRGFTACTLAPVISASVDKMGIFSHPTVVTQQSMIQLNAVNGLPVSSSTLQLVPSLVVASMGAFGLLYLHSTQIKYWSIFLSEM